MRESLKHPLRSLDLLRTAAAFGALLLGAGCGSTARNNTPITEDAGVAECTNGDKRCDSGKWQACANQQWKDVETCSAWCDKALGCTKCAPNGTVCDGQNVLACDAQGNPGKFRATCAEMCVGGTCTDACGRAAAELSYLGCDYFPTVTSNNDLIQASHFAVAVANPNDVAVDIVITRGNFKLDNIHVMPGDLQTIQLPWVKELLQAPGIDNNGLPAYASRLVPEGAYKLNSTQPVNVYQFNPLEFAVRPNCADGDRTCFTFSNDASLLLPTSTMTGHYIVIARPTWMMNENIDNGPPFTPVDYKLTSPGFFAVVGAEDLEQEVKVAFRAPTLAGYSGAFNAFRAGETGTFKLKQGDVLQMMSAAPAMCTPKANDIDMQQTTDQFGRDVTYTYGYCDLGEGWDLTGTEITSDHKIAVFGGHNCTFVPYNKWACDHLEESMLPLESWGRQYIGSKVQRQPATIPDLWRIVSGADGNMITFDPPSAHDPVMLDKGKWIEFTSKIDFVVNGTQAFAVAQYMVGQNYGNAAGPGDPAMSIAVPTEQYRKDYTFLTPATYTYNYVNVTAPANVNDGTLLSDITLDGQVIDPGTFKSIGSGTYKVARIRLPKDGAHKISSGQPFGIEVYGLASFTSYMYPGGLDVKQINLQ